MATRPWSGHAADDEVTAATTATAALLADLGHDVEETEDLLDWEPFLTAMTDVWAADAAHTVDGLAHVLGRPVDDTTVEGATLAAVTYGRTVTAPQLMDALDQANHVARRMGRYFRRTTCCSPRRSGGSPPRWALRPGRADGAARRLRHVVAVGVVPARVQRDRAAGDQPPAAPQRTGLPIGMQLVGASGAEALLLRLAAAARGGAALGRPRPRDPRQPLPRPADAWRELRQAEGCRRGSPRRRPCGAEPSRSTIRTRR